MLNLIKHWHLKGKYGIEEKKHMARLTGCYVAAIWKHVKRYGHLRR
jgi:hypothetical protein